MTTVEKTQDVNDNVLQHIYSCFPPFILGRSLLKLSEQSFLTDILNDERPVFSYEVLGRFLMILTIHATALIPMVLIIERFLMTKTADMLANLVGLCRMKVGCCMGAPVDDGEEEDETNPAADANDIEMNSVTGLDQDVVREQEFVRSGDAKQDEATVLLMDNLCKVYPPRGLQASKVAVDHLSVAVKRGTCFGLLGINGAGKSTTMAMLTGHVTPTSGDALVNGYSISKNMHDVRNNSVSVLNSIRCQRASQGTKIL